MAVNGESSPRTPLTRAAIIRTAVALADESGLEAVSMRSLAGRLGVTAMSLYNHVANKDDILAGMVDAVFEEIELPEESDWKAAIRTSSISAREALLRHTWATSLLLSSRSDGPARLRHSDWQLHTLRRGGLSEEAIFHAFHILESHLLGSALQQQSFPYAGEELADMARRYLQDFPMDEYPDMGEHIKQHLESEQRQQDGFEFALDLILDGLERVRDGDDPGRS